MGVCDKISISYFDLIKVPNRICISERPVEADGRRFGDFEMDTIVGKDGHAAIVTLTEMSTNKMIAKSIGTKVYFAVPYSSWQKGAIENVNGLIWQYIPKNTCFSNISQQQITKIMQKINTRPREKLNFSSPNECFYKKIS